MSPSVPIGRPTVVIPTYWGRPSYEPFNTSDDLYDHPTPVDQAGTLARALESFKMLEGGPEFDIVVLAVATNETLREACERQAASIIEPFRDDLSVRLFGYHELDWLQERMRANGVGDLVDLVELRGYCNVRNLCLLVTALSGSDIAVFFDDDEIMVDSDYMTKATENLGKVTMGSQVFFVAGYYLRPEADTWEIPHTPDWRDAEWRGTDEMNAAFQIIGQPPRLKPTPFAFGGNMVVHRKIFERCCFDPHVTRGEDIDFLMGAKMLGFEAFLDNELKIKHLPPTKHAPAWRDFRENVIRFVYQREKLRSQKRVPGMRKLALEETMPYPGAFLGDDLDDKIFKTCTLNGMEALTREDTAAFDAWMDTIAIGRWHAKPDFDPFDDWVDRCGRWRRLIAAIADDTTGQAEWRSGFPG